MITPIIDFARSYIESEQGRFHMPGHKGKTILGLEPWDLTEIPGADDLHHPTGIIRQSEENASSLFDCPTIYGTEGSSQCIRAMLFLAIQGCKDRPLILAGRNAHKVFVNASVLLDFDIGWLYPAIEDSYLSCLLSPADVETAILHAPKKPSAVYLTSPDYLGNISDIKGISEICRKHNILLIVDNAHGAYLRFLTPSQHPMDLGADMCCDSAHKTFPVLTGGAYLHTKEVVPHIKEVMALFGSTSPSYLIMESLDQCNPYLETLPEVFNAFVPKVEEIKKQLISSGYVLLGNEPLKITLDCKKRGYTGEQISSILEEKGITCEFADPDFAVFMLTPQNTDDELQYLLKCLNNISQKGVIKETAPIPGIPICKLRPRQATFSKHETIPCELALGRILASPGVSCPPAVPIVVCGEQINEAAIRCFRYYGIDQCNVVCE